MRLQTTLLAAVAATFAAGFAASSVQAATVEVEDAVARVTVIPENRKDIKVEVISANPRLPLKVRTMGDRTIVDGDLDRKIRNCRSSGATSKVHVRGVGDISWSEMPQIVIHTPRDVRVEAGGAVFGSVVMTTVQQATSDGDSTATSFAAAFYVAMGVAVCAIIFSSRVRTTPR